MFSRAFRSSLKPIELGRRLVKEMDARRTLDVHGRAIVPNVYRFTLSPADHHAFHTIEGPLVRELIDAAKEHARSEGYGLLGPLRVVLGIDETLRSGQLQLVSEMSATARPASGVAAAAPPAAAPAPAAAPPAAPVAPSPVVAAPPVASAAATAFPPLDAEERPAWTADPLSWASGPHDLPAAAPAEPADTVVSPTPARTPSAVLVLATGQTVELTADRTATIGRLPSCEVLVNDANVSRRHAEVRPHGAGWVLADLGSTNGTRVNGAVVGEHVLTDGDVVTVGGTRLRYEVR